MELNIAVLPGDGIGPEVTRQAVKCLRAVEETFGHKFKFTSAEVVQRPLRKPVVPYPIKLWNSAKKAMPFSLELSETLPMTIIRKQRSALNKDY